MQTLDIIGSLRFMSAIIAVQCCIDMRSLKSNKKIYNSKCSHYVKEILLEISFIEKKENYLR